MTELPLVPPLCRWAHPCAGPTTWPQTPWQIGCCARQPVKIALWALSDYAGEEHKAVYLLGTGTFDLLYTGSTGRGVGTVRARVYEHRRDPRKAEVTWVLVFPMRRDADVEQAEGEVGRLLGRPRLSRRIPRPRLTG